VLLSPFETRPVWLLVRTKPKQEKLAVEGLAARGIDAYCPRVLEPRTHIRAPHTPVPLFPSYVFGRCIVSEGFHALSYCPGVAGAVRFGDHLAAVDDEDVEYIQQKESGRGYLVPSSVHRPPVKGSRIKVFAGPFRGIQGVVEQYLPSQNRVRLLLEVVSGKWRAQMDADHVRVA